MMKFPEDETTPSHKMDKHEDENSCLNICIPSEENLPKKRRSLHNENESMENGSINYFMKQSKSDKNLEDSIQFLENENKLNYSNNSNNLKKDNKTKEILYVRKGWKRYIGLCFGLGASFSFSVAMIFVKVLLQYDPATIGLWRFFGSFTISLPVLFYYSFIQKKQIFKPIWPLTEVIKFKIGMLIVFRGIFGCSAMILQIYSLKYIELPDSTVIALSTPVFVSLVARIFLGEKCGIIPVLAALLTFCGVTIITRPPLLTGAKEFDIDTLIGTAIAFSSMICSASVFIILRYLRELHFTLVISINGIVGLIECLIVSIITSKLDIPQSTLDWLYGLSAGLFTYFGHLFLTAALKYEQAGPISLTRTCDVIFAFILQFIFLNIYPDIFSLVGSSIVIIAVIIVVTRKWLSTLPEDDLNRNRYSCFLK